VVRKRTWTLLARGKKITLPSTMWRLWSIRHIPLDLSPLGFLLFLRVKSLRKGQWFSSAQDVTAKATWVLTEVSKNGIPWIFPTALRTLTKVCHWQRIPILGKCCVNRCKFTYSCVNKRIPGTFWSFSYVLFPRVLYYVRYVYDPMRSLDSSIDLILPATQQRWDRLSL
jgi:hypothetical protein